MSNNESGLPLMQDRQAQKVYARSILKAHHDFMVRIDPNGAVLKD